VRQEGVRAAAAAPQPQTLTCHRNKYKQRTRGGAGAQLLRGGGGDVAEWPTNKGSGGGSFTAAGGALGAGQSPVAM
jgi:hypothetical protein